MRNAKHLVMTAIMMLISIFTITYSSCTKEKIDPCKTVACLHGGNCIGGTCSCLTGYEGVNCQIAINEKLAGRFTGNDCDGSASYTITAGTTNGTAIYLPLSVSDGTCSGNFSLMGDITNTGSFAFPTKVYNVCSTTFSIGATGAIVGSILSINFTVTIPGVGTETCSFTGSK